MPRASRSETSPRIRSRQPSSQSTRAIQPSANLAFRPSFQESINSPTTSLVVSEIMNAFYVAVLDLTALLPLRGNLLLDPSKLAGLHSSADVPDHEYRQWPEKSDHAWDPDELPILPFPPP